jgi:hypothetical protein
MAMTTLRTGAIVQALGGELFGDPDGRSRAWRRWSGRNPASSASWSILG